MQPKIPPISPSPFIGWSDDDLIKAAFDETIGYSRGRAIWDLALRAKQGSFVITFISLSNIARQPNFGDRH